MNIPSLSAGQLPIDWILLAVVAGFVAFDCFRHGPARACAIALALPLAVVLKESLAGALFIDSIVQSFQTPVLQAIVFITLFVCGYVLIHRMTYAFSDGTNGIAQAILSSVAVTVILASVWVATPALQNVWHFGTNVQGIFGTVYKFWWLAFGYLILAFARG